MNKKDKKKLKYQKPELKELASETAQGFCHLGSNPINRCRSGAWAWRRCRTGYWVFGWRW